MLCPGYRERQNVYLLELNCGTYIEPADADSGSVTSDHESDVVHLETIAPEMSSDEDLPSKQSTEDCAQKEQQQEQHKELGSGAGALF